jgi:hypothetical protein
VEPRVELLHSFSNYETRKSHMSKIQTDEFKYPCIQNVNVRDELSCVWYSKTKDAGHFGIQKVMLGRKVCGAYLDLEGSYGMCQDCFGIIDTPANLENIHRAVKSREFIELSESCDVGGSRDRYNRKILALFRKDFWKDFI